MSAVSDAIKAKAEAEIAKIKDEAVQEFIKLKLGHYSFTVLWITATVAFVLGALIF